MAAAPSLLLLFPLLTVHYTVSDTLSDMTSVLAVSGGRAELPCVPVPRIPEDQPLLVLWYLSSNTRPIYSYDARAGDFETGDRWADQEVLGGRAFFAAHARPPTLVLEPTHAHDQGLYTCRVDYRLSPSTTSLVNLTVIITPGPPVVLWGGVGVVGGLGPLGEGERLQVVCRSVGGRPPPVLTWWWRGSKLPSQLTSTTPNTGEATVDATLVVVAAREMQRATLTCQARTTIPAHHTAIPAHHTAVQPTTQVLQPHSVSVTLNITLPPLEVKILGSGGPVSAGKTVKLVCRSVGSHPPAELTWWRAHTRLKQVSYALEGGGNVTSATLTLAVTRDLDGATLVCTAANPLLPHAPLAHSVKLDVFYTPVVNLSLSRHLDASIIKEGQDVILECSVRANPAIHRVDWYHNVRPRAQYLASGRSTVPDRLDTLPAYNYSGWQTTVCSLTGGPPLIPAPALRQQRSTQLIHKVFFFFIEVKVGFMSSDAPVCAGGVMHRVQGATRGTPTVVTCRVEALPAHTLTWEWAWLVEDGSELPLADEDIRCDGLASSVVVTPLTPADYGKVLCRASNVIGRQLESCVVTLVPAGPPDTPTNCSATSTDAAQDDAHTSSLTVICYEGYNGGLPQEFLMEAWQEGTLVANITSEYPEWVVDGLESGSGITLRVTALNARGRSDALRLEAHTASAQHRAAPESESDGSGVATMLGAVVGVAVMVVVVLLVSVVVAVHAHPHRRGGHTLVLAPAGEGWECQDPDLVSSSQRRQRSVDVLADAHGQREPLVHVHADTLTHVQVNGRVINSSKHGQAESPLRESNSRSGSCSNSAEGRAAATLAAAVTPAAGPAPVPTTTAPVAAKGKQLSVLPPTAELVVHRTSTFCARKLCQQPYTGNSRFSQRQGKSCQAALIREFPASQPSVKESLVRQLCVREFPSSQPCVKESLVTQPCVSAQGVHSSPKACKNNNCTKKHPKARGDRKLVRFSDNNKEVSECRHSMTVREEPKADSGNMAPEEDTSSAISNVQRGKKASELTPPPKPPRVFNQTRNGDGDIQPMADPSVSRSQHTPFPRGSQDSPVHNGSQPIPVPERSHPTPIPEGSHPTPIPEGSQPTLIHDGSQRTIIKMAPLAEDEVRDAYSNCPARSKGVEDLEYCDPGITESAM
nr:LOW QUALITY PROTEIN: uncharacterized protein LOC128697074 [Cherax quadricarinatus]